jgi:glyoxylase I family protein
MTEFLQLHHASLVVNDTQQSLRFYCDILGLPIEPARPDLGFPGAWLRVADQQIHLLELPNPDPVEGRPGHPGRDRHLALRVRGLNELENALKQAAVPYTRSRSGRRALFCRDPDGNGIELIEVPV